MDQVIAHCLTASSHYLNIGLDYWLCFFVTQNDTRSGVCFLDLGVYFKWRHPVKSFLFINRKWADFSYSYNLALYLCYYTDKSGYPCRRNQSRFNATAGQLVRSIRNGVLRTGKALWHFGIAVTDCYLWKTMASIDKGDVGFVKHWEMGLHSPKNSGIYSAASKYKTNADQQSTAK